MPSSEPHRAAEWLRQRLGDIDAALQALQERVRPVALDQTLQGRLSRIDAIGQQQMAQASLAQLRRERLRIEAALQRIAAGSYGRCCRCRLELDPERLSADPSAPLCLDCVDALQQTQDGDLRR